MLRVSLLLGRWIQVVNLHIDPQWPLRLRRHALRSIAQECKQCEGQLFLVGNSSFVAGRGHRERLEPARVKEASGMHTLVGVLFVGMGVNVQQEPTARRLS